MRKCVSLAAALVTFTVLTLPASAQTRPASAQAPSQAEEEKAVLEVVRRLFDGMRTRDTTLMKSVFAPDARFHGLNREGVVQLTTPAEFIEGIGSAPPGLLLDEVLHEVEVRIDGPLATVWTYYDFFAGDNFSHCGYNAFQMLKTRDGWKAVSLADSRRREGCRQKRS